MFSELSFMGKFLRCIDFPVKYFIYATALPVEKDHYSKTRALIWVVPGWYFMLWIFIKEWFNMAYLYLGLPCAVLTFICFITLLEKDKAPKWFMVFTCQGVLAGLMYTYLLIGVLIDQLNALGTILNLDNTYLGLTILAIGNALPDALTTISLFKQGAGKMAISGAYAGQLFGLLVGFGLSQLKNTYLSGTQNFNLFNMDYIDQNILDLMVIGSALIVLVFTWFWGFFNKFSMTKVFAFILIALYAVFLIASTIIAVTKAVKSY